MKQNNIPSLWIWFFLAFVILPSFGKYIIPALIVFLFVFSLKNNFFKKKTGVNEGSKNFDYSIDINNFKNMKKTKSLIASSLLLVFVLWLFFSSIVIIDAGETGVYSLFGKVKDDELRSGFHLVIPLAHVSRMTIRTEEYTMSVQKGEGQRYDADAITSLTKEGLSVDLDLTALYRLNEEQASDIYREVGLNYEEKIIRPIIRTSIRDIIAQYEAKDIYSEKRQEASQKIKDSLSESLANRGIIIEDVLLRNVSLPANLSKAIQEKLQAEQEAQKYDFILAKEKKEKERKVIEAEGQRDAQKIINESLSTNYLYYSYISSLNEREGTIYVPTSPTTGMPMFRNLGN